MVDETVGLVDKSIHTALLVHIKVINPLINRIIQQKQDDAMHFLSALRHIHKSYPPRV